MKTDKRETIPLELSDDELFKLMLRAHEMDITLNQLVEKILTDFIEEHKRGLSEKTDKNEKKAS